MHGPDPGDLDHIELFAEQLDLIAELMRAGGLARGRMALVALDNLAEVLLYRHLQSAFGASEEMGGRLAVRRYDQRERDRLRRDFDRRVTFAMTDQTGLMGFAYPRPLLDHADATIFRVAHRYRNGVYHQDRHSPALLDPLSRLYAAAVCRAWRRAQVQMTMGSANPDWLCSLPHVAATAKQGAVSLPHAVEAITDGLLSGLGVTPRDLAERLAADLVQRAEGTKEMRREFVRCGVPADVHAVMLRAAELRYLHRADPKLVSLEEDASETLGRLVNGQLDDSQVEDLRARFRNAEEQQRERMQELDSDFRPQLNLRSGSSLKRAAGRLAQLRDLDRVLTRYEVLDDRMLLLEGCLEWIDREWDRFVSTEEEIARGK
jgi:hypothetical protein